MYDKELVVEIFKQVETALKTIHERTIYVKAVSDFTQSPSGMEKLDSVCMQFMAIGENMKNIDKITQGQLLLKYPEIDWIGIKGFRDILAHHYFTIDADQVYWVLKNELKHITHGVQKIILDLC